MSDAAKVPVAQLRRELVAVQQALDTPGAGARGSLECRVADLQDRLLKTPAGTLADLEAKLETIRTLVAGLGPRGYLLDLTESTLADLRALRDRLPAVGPR